MKIAKITFEGTPAEFQIEDVRALFATASQPTAERVLTGKAVEAAEEDDVLTEDVAANVLTRLDLSRSQRAVIKAIWKAGSKRHYLVGGVRGHRFEAGGFQGDHADLRQEGRLHGGLA